MVPRESDIYWLSCTLTRIRGYYCSKAGKIQNTKVVDLTRTALAWLQLARLLSGKVPRYTAERAFGSEDIPADETLKLYC